MNVEYTTSPKRRLRLLVVVLCAALSADTFAVAPSVMAPMAQLGPQSTGIDLKPYAQVLHVSASAPHRTITAALDSIKDASARNRYAILVAAGNFAESRIAMKPHVDLYGGVSAADWKQRDVYASASIVDAGGKGPVIIAADHARLDGFVITGGAQKAHGGGIVCDGVSPTIVNNIIVGNRTLKPTIGEGLGKQIANEGAGIALLHGSRAYVCNNLICENSTEIGAGAGITARDNVEAKILRNVFCNNVAGDKDDSMFHGKVGSRSSPGAAIACSEQSSPQISFNCIVLGSAPINNDAGGIWVEGNSRPPINYNWIVGNLSGDDGGGIYVMGNLYFDDTGVRHDLPPDGPVVVEDNIIAGNNCTRGGPGGVRVSRWGRVELRRNTIVGQQKSGCVGPEDFQDACGTDHTFVERDRHARLTPQPGRVELRRNTIVGNGKGAAHGAEGGVITLMENNVIADNGAKRDPAKPRFRLTADIAGRNFDPLRYATEFTLGGSLGKEDLAGSIVRVGGQWSVVKSNAPGKLIVWGKVTDESPKLELLEDYSANSRESLPNHAK